MMMKAMLLLGLCVAVQAKGNCTDYFGAGVDSNATSGTLYTIADTDVTEGFPLAQKTFVHHSGPGSACIPPGPPQGCHRYYVASYDAAKCPSTCPIRDPATQALAGQMDTAGAFDRGAGVLNGCFECLIDVSIKCYGAPADEPVKCTCPGA